ncbi:unnamed protein product [Brassica rapa subsp. trilocularis]
MTGSLDVICTFRARYLKLRDISLGRNFRASPFTPLRFGLLSDWIYLINPAPALCSYTGTLPYVVGSHPYRQSFLQESIAPLLIGRELR